MQNALILNKPGFTLTDVFGAGFSSLSEKGPLNITGKDVFVTGTGLRRIRYFDRYTGIFIVDQYKDILNRVHLRKLQRNLEALLTYNEDILPHILTLGEREQMELYAEYGFLYTSKMERAQKKLDKFRSRHGQFKILFQISEVQEQFINAILATDAALTKIVYPDRPNPRSPEFIKSLKAAYEGFELED